MGPIDARSRQASQASLITIIANLALTIARAVVAWLSGSTAVLADALNSGSDIMASLITMATSRLASQPPDADHLYGHAKLEIEAAKITATILLLTAASSAWTSFKAFAQPGAPGTSAIWITLIAIGVKEGLARFLLKTGRKLRHAGLVADGHNQRSDVLASLAVLVGVVGARLGLPILDPIAGLVVALLIGRLGWQIYWSALQESIDKAPAAETLTALKRAAASIPGVTAVTDLKARLHGPYIHVDIKLAVPYHLSVWDGHQISRQVVDRLHCSFPDVKWVMVHVNPDGEPKA